LGVLEQLPGAGQTGAAKLRTTTTGSSGITASTTPSGLVADEATAGIRFYYFIGQIPRRAQRSTH
jgi:hypothetical protein